jgi:predicted PolB exonuclease-like 3'-5' exonuclease
MKIYNQIKNFLFLDIETVREYRTYTEFSQYRSTAQWERLAKKMMADENLTPAESYQKKGALYVEYGKVVSVAFGKFVSENGDDFTKKIGALADPSEETLLRKVADFLNKKYDENPDVILCGHNIKEFDIPFLIKRMIKYNIKLPVVLKNYLSAKSWDQKATDTLYDWRMAGNRFMSLDAIAEYLGIPSSKTGEVSGDGLGEFYWNDPQPIEVKIAAINTYCKEDVRALMDLAKRLYDVL